VAKLARTVSRRQPTKTTRKLELVHSDVGTMPIALVGGSKYYLTFTDDKTRYKWILLMKKKSDFEAVFHAWRQRVEMETQQKLQRFRTDGGGEYTSNTLLSALFKAGTKHEKTPAYTPEMNGVSERLNRTLVEATKAMLYDAELDDSWWGEAIMTATYLRNLLPTGDRMTTPFEEWKGIRPNLQHLRIFGSECWVQIPKQLRMKLNDHAKKGIFVGYRDTQNTYRVAMRDKVLTYQDIRFNETLRENALYPEIRGSTDKESHDSHDKEDRDEEVGDYNEDQDSDIGRGFPRPGLANKHQQSSRFCEEDRNDDTSRLRNDPLYSTVRDTVP